MIDGEDMIQLRSRYPLVRQYDQLDCGPAALLSVLRFYGGDTTLVRARRLCRTDLQGTTMLDLARAARAMGFEARGARGTLEQLAHEPLPCIAHVVLPEGLNHFLIIYRITPKRLLVGDPGKGRYTLSPAAFEKLWRQHAVLLLEPAGNGVHRRGRLSSAKSVPVSGLLREPAPGWLRWIGGYLHQQQAWLQQILFTGVLYTGAGLLTALFVQTLIDRLIPGRQSGKLLLFAGAMLVVLALRATLGYLRDRLLVTANKRLSLTVTGDFLVHLFRLPKDFFDGRKTGDITSRIDDSLRIHRTCLLLLQSALLDLLIALGALLFLFYFSLHLGLLTLALLPPYIVVLWRQARRLKEQQREAMKSHAAVEATYIDSIQGMPEIMSFNAAPAFTRLNQGAFGHFQERIERLGLMQAGLTLAVGLLGAAISVSLLALGAWQVMAEELHLGQFMAAWSLLGYILPAVTGLVAAFVEFQGAEVAAQRLMDLLLVEQEAEATATAVVMPPAIAQKTPTVADGVPLHLQPPPTMRGSESTLSGEEPVGVKERAQPPDEPATGRRLASPDSAEIPPAAECTAAPDPPTAPLPLVQVDKLTFAWPKSPELLREVSLELPAGRITGLWGPSGAGKSTLVQLLQRKYAPLTGRICWEATPIDRLLLTGLRSRIGVVPQQIKIFNATLAENLLMGRPAASLQEISDGLHELGLDLLPGRFEHGLLTLLGEEGRKLSGGETQLLALARALYGRPPLLVIDEGFSAIDADLERILAGLIASWAREHAVLLITHNLESLRRTDFVYLLKDGRIAEEGRPQDLIEADGLFADLLRMKHPWITKAGAWA